MTTTNAMAIKDSIVNKRQGPGACNSTVVMFGNPYGPTAQRGTGPPPWTSSGTLSVDVVLASACWFDCLFFCRVGLSPGQEFAIESNQRASRLSFERDLDS
jgi:hypothetical protein